MKSRWQDINSNLRADRLKHNKKVVVMLKDDEDADIKKEIITRNLLALGVTEEQLENLKFHLMHL